MGQLAHAYPRFVDAGVALAMLSVDSPKRARQLAEAARPQPTFPVLSDRDADVTVDYNVFADGIAIASTFLIDRAGRVRWTYVAKTPADRPSVDQLLAQVASLRADGPT
jgi:alkyl hydroperoxide reductase subunit AhpC